MPQDTKIKQLIINKLNKAKFNELKESQSLSETELYVITDEEHYTSQEVQELLDNKQNILIPSDKISIVDDVISIDLSEYYDKSTIDSLFGAELDYSNSVLNLKAKNGGILSSVTIKSTPNLDKTTIHLNSNETLEVIGNKTKDGTIKYDWIGTQEEYNVDKESVITDTTVSFIIDDEENLIGGIDVIVPTKLSELANDSNFVTKGQLDTKVDKEEGKSLVSDTEIERLVALKNYDDTEIKQNIQDLQNTKVDKEEGKSLVSDAEIERLSNVVNYDDSQLVSDNLTNKNNISLLQNNIKKCLNYNQISNCILEAPNGVITYNENTITFKQGLKILIPKGRDSNGVFQNEELVLSQDVIVSYDLSGYSCNFTLLYGNNDWFISQNYKQQDIPPEFDGNNQCYYNISENKIYFNNNSNSWEEKYVAVVGEGVILDGVITSFVSHQPVEIIKRTDPQIQAPYIIETYENGTSWYRLWSDGWLEQGITFAAIPSNSIISLLKPYKEPKYSILVCDTGGGQLDVGAGDRAVDSFKLYNAPAGTDIGLTWITLGYAEI